MSETDNSSPSGISINSTGDTNIGGDVVGRDKITNIYNIPHQDVHTEAIQKVMAACYRRSVFTRTHAQLSMTAMIASLAQCRSVLQQLATYIQPKEAREMVVAIIGEIDTIERHSGEPDRIDEAKLRIINLLLRLSRLTNIPYELPTHLTEDFFFTEDEASKAPGS